MINRCEDNGMPCPPGRLRAPLFRLPVAGYSPRSPETAAGCGHRGLVPARTEPGTRGGSARAPSASFLLPGNLLVSRSVYTASPASIAAGKTVLPPGCTTGCAVATASGAYPQVFNNVLADPAFGVTSPVFLDQLTPSGRMLSTVRVPSAGGLVTSFSSKSELALNVSTSGREVSFMGYAAAPGTVDVSNSNTPGAIDPTNPVPGADFRVVAQLDGLGRFRFTTTNAYSGDNGRAAILNDARGADVAYLAGNAGNGSSPQPDGIIEGAGAQILTPASRPESAQQPGAPTPVGSFSATQLGDKADKVGKDTNFRGMTVFGNVLYYSKDSGSNGVNTVYFVDTTGKACPDGVGAPQPGAQLPTSPIAFDPAQLQDKGVVPDNMCVLQGFPTALKSATSFPAGLWFANASTLYVTDEGNGTTTFADGGYTAAAAQATAGLQKWVRQGGTWKLAYTLTAGLHLGVPYTVRGYPAGDNPATGLPWSPATDGLRNIAGRVNANGTVTIWAITSTVSGSGDPGADPDKLVAITDRLAAASAPADSFTTVRTARLGEVLRGVSFTPGSVTRP
jgi:hypothetical protein